MAARMVATEAESRRYKTTAMNSNELRDHCLSYTGSEETFPFGPKTSVFKVAGKMFALSQLGADSLRVSLKCEPELAEALRGAYAAVIPGYHLNKRHWNTVLIDGSLPDADDQGHDRGLIRPGGQPAPAVRAPRAWTPDRLGADHRRAAPRASALVAKL